MNLFESSVNSEGIETIKQFFHYSWLFESSVNSEGIETHLLVRFPFFSLRAV